MVFAWLEAAARMVTARAVRVVRTATPVCGVLVIRGSGPFGRSTSRGRTAVVFAWLEAAARM
ncbi:hypothetical protein, partial [Corynebacterium bovis]|uniref:hypothetical protein n=1 Tax=Corynebacterium bovis TaxID=36808 RepID=UPI00313987F7